ncbi:protein involved in polysaccharide export, contains SLBB domain of the beta-grasp fold [Chitinophaga ginsengisegetis]|uniref:Protein involved in polysaccharide export, contains SLBB domain of the beta-grasp fold n=1 Tax=Chitinophaga ginsengisegetis TaxID=393003 RepID=A0A1T5P5F3_9BACT|nr:SLBB domain-containing protein [Chitinophaga ginsengisegetis]SKD07921.1 protein involved in polysaccharide export, contains SLBB domain of the beta-grasp fold [Chitinophaga ginsengisegetis]
MLRKILLVQLFLFVGFCVMAQVPSPAQIKQVNVDNLSDDQIRRIVAEMKQNNLGMDDIDSYAEEKGIPSSEAEKLKSRIQMLGLDKTLDKKKSTEIFQQDNQYSGRSFNDSDTSKVDLFRQNVSPSDIKRRKIFGAELFTNKNLTFEPNLRIPTPSNYKLAADDQVMIDVYGYSEVQYKLTVTSEGYIRIPNLGPVYVNGLTMDEAKNRITKQLSTIYSTISSGKTFVQISLGDIRSIRVLLIGEIYQPGSYTLPSLATVANALYVSGGPDENGSFRNIQVIRNGQVITTFDLYDFIAKGDLANNIVLQDQDIVKVNPYKTRVELLGEVKRPAIFEAKDNETLQNILDYAGGYTDGSFKENITGYRINNKEREVINVPADQIASFKLKSGDQFFVDSILNRFSNRVTISGAVFHPGNYGLEPGMTLSDLIKKADGVREEASLNRGIIRRLQDDFTPAIISFNVQDVINGRANIPVKKEDSVIIFSKLDLRQQYSVLIGGEVNKPGSFPFADSMRLEDLVLLAGGLKDAASLKHVEVSRRIRKGEYNSKDSSRAIIRQFDISADLSSIVGEQVALEPFDEVVIRKSPAYSEQANISIEGEVVYPGQYTIVSKGEHISDLIKRSGGLRPEAFPEGAVLLRKTYISSADSALLNNKLELFYSKLEDSSSITSVKNMMERKYQLLGINLDDVVKKPGSKYDILLEEGDVLKIPKKLQTVQMFGEIYFPKKIRYDNGYAFRDYIRGAGGYTASALKRRSYVVYANGEVKSTRKIFFFNKYPKVKPGAEVYVPSKKDRKGLTGGEAIGLASGLASIALIIVTILNKL